ncbi:MAG: molybdenum cofactor biosynthesis protein B [Terriglobia bacterium]
MPGPYRAVILTISDSVSQGTRQDISGPAVKSKLEEAGWTVRGIEALPDDFNLIRERLTAWASETDVDSVFTTGGTGLAPRDRTPEATTAVMERSLPGLAELMRREGLKQTPLAVLSRAVAGVRSKTLLINLPGSPQGAVESLAALLEILPHAVDVIRGEVVHERLAAPVEAPAPEAEPAATQTPVVAPAAEETGTDQEPLGKSEPV